MIDREDADGRFPANHTELNEIEMLWGYTSQLSSELKEHRMFDRMRLVQKRTGKNVLRTYNAAVKMLDGVLVKMLDTMPWEQLMRLKREAQNGVYRLVPKGYRIKETYPMGEDHLETLFNCVAENECKMCIREGREIGACPYRKIFMAYIPPEKPSKFGCEYQNAAFGDFDKNWSKESKK